MQLIQNNINNSRSVSAFFTDYKIMKTFKNDKPGLKFLLENIFTQKPYQIEKRLLAAYQSFYTIPLIGRNALVKFRAGL